MSVEKILNADWSVIDRKKTVADQGTITCDEINDIEHLIAAFKKHYPGYNEKEIIYAIAASWRTAGGKQQRDIFITDVAARLCGYDHVLN